MVSAAEIIAKTSAMFDSLNGHFYQDELPHPTIEVKFASENKHHRSYNPCEIRSLDSIAKFVLRVYDEYIFLSATDAAANMLHEMAHLYNRIHAIKDVSGSAFYHNKRFKITAETHGLCCSYSDKYAWAITTLADDAQAWLSQQAISHEFSVFQDAANVPEVIERIHIWSILKAAPMRASASKRAANSLCEIINRRIEQGVSNVEDELDFCEELDFLLEHEGLRNIAIRIETVNRLYDLCGFEHFWLG